METCLAGVLFEAALPGGPFVVDAFLSVLCQSHLDVLVLARVHWEWRPVHHFELQVALNEHCGPELADGLHAVELAAGVASLDARPVEDLVRVVVVEAYEQSFLVVIACVLKLQDIHDNLVHMNREKPAVVSLGLGELCWHISLVVSFHLSDKALSPANALVLDDVRRLVWSAAGVE